MNRDDGSQPMTNQEARPQPARLDREALRQRVIEVMQTVYDPEIPVNIYELGMVYDIAIDPEANAVVTMTLTSPMCPVAGSLPGEVETKLGSIDGLASVRVELVWEPAWTPDRMSEAAKLQLGMM
jgi:FeS assembly SUF system protein